MNILFIAYNLYPEVAGGMEIFNYYLIKELAKFHKIFVITSSEAALGEKVVILKINPRKFGLRRISVPMQDFMYIKNLRNKIDLFHISYTSGNCLGWLPYPFIKKMYGIPYIISIHGGGMHDCKPRFPHRLLFKNASVIVGVSECIKREYEKRSGRYVEFIPPLIPFKRCERDTNKIMDKYGFHLSNNILLTVGSLKKIKGSDILLDAFMSLGKDFIDRHNLRLFFVGDGEMRKDLEKITEEKGFIKYVKFAGTVLQDEIPAIYKMSNIYVIPSLFEGMSISMSEAMFNGLPIIASDANGLKDIIKDGENGILFKSQNSRELADKIAYLIKNKDIALKISKEASKGFNGNFSFNKVVSQYEKLYENIIKEAYN